jgi:glutamate synthase domain-containing protein 3
VVVEGVGDHGCEYMTGGRAIILGSTGKNFAAGMSGGIAYVLDLDGSFKSRVNTSMVELMQLDDSAEECEVRSLIEEHQSRTGSLRAGEVLTNWSKMKDRFVKVISPAYRTIMEQAKNKDSIAKEAAHG